MKEMERNQQIALCRKQTRTAPGNEGDDEDDDERSS
jgi:hypothetical protein